jgi:glycosyltransferase involved in cell wall biosynthesis
VKINLLSNNIPWFGKYSGYECLPNYFSDLQPSIYSAKPTLSNRAMGRWYRFLNNWDDTNSEQAYTGLTFLRGSKKVDLSHILYLETHLHLLKKTNLISDKILGTIHLPVRQWEEKNLKLLSGLSNLIVLYKEEIDRFKMYTNEARIHFIQHGVDIGFFRPGDPQLVNKNKVLFVGHYLRNFDMMLKVYNTITNEISDKVEFHFIIPSIWRGNIPVLQNIGRNKNVFFHEKLSDEELLLQYQTSNILLMPMEDSGANTAIVQAVSIGLPVVTTDVGGIRSYGGADIFPIIDNNNHLLMVELFNKYFTQREFRDEISVAQRNYAINNLDWNIIANKHAALYDDCILQYKPKQ